ncbi:hypothetical protein QBC33DRAFT_543523 [Phialemonium atrogriseum]|uniref:Uncharacterized protein n=1 Tax=Phialemonium atrogriseum TaxID=1093897 RepID=A0AAJ0FEJ8_9PEZI|nr:uncharacterized protein QBC33DRAFT_543523 [Phialemonium atrogriseum]KAK1765656.1 hypothetical protein QBC33DRAFT_543523 [Phialemonium atrogriseum]
MVGWTPTWFDRQIMAVSLPGCTKFWRRISIQTSPPVAPLPHPMIIHPGRRPAGELLRLPSIIPRHQSRLIYVVGPRKKGKRKRNNSLPFPWLVHSVPWSQNTVAFVLALENNVMKWNSCQRPNDDDESAKSDDGDLKKPGRNRYAPQHPHEGGVYLDGRQEPAVATSSRMGCCCADSGQQASPVPFPGSDSPPLWIHANPATDLHRIWPRPRQHGLRHRAKRDKTFPVLIKQYMMRSFSGPVAWPIWDTPSLLYLTLSSNNKFPKLLPNHPC